MRAKPHLLFSPCLGSVRWQWYIHLVAHTVPVPKRIVRHVTGAPHGCVSSLRESKDRRTFCYAIIIVQV
jgi:hypothetical protein